MNYRKINMGAALAVAWAWSLSAALADVENGPDCRACEASAIRTFQSAVHEAQADYRLELARGYNLPKASERREAWADAREEREEALDEAADQLEARLELCEELGECRYNPDIDPANFMDQAEIQAAPNPLWPLVIGNEWTYRSEDEDGVETNIVTVTDVTVDILGVECIEVRDVVKVDGVLVEDTRDWYAQDQDGNVWYFGELSVNFDEDGEVEDIEGSWKSGEDGAQPGIIMFANPERGCLYRQEYLLGEAEDYAKVIGTVQQIVTTFGTFQNCLKIFESTPIEPEDALEFKYYHPDVGPLIEKSIVDGSRSDLINFRNIAP